MNSGTVGRVSVATGVYASIGAAGVISNTNGGGLAFAGGQLYGFSLAGGLHAVNTATGAFGPQIGATSPAYAEGNAFGVGASLYDISGTSLYSVDTATGAPTLLGPITGANLPAGFFGASVNPAPEPGRVLLAAGGALGLAARLRRRIAG